MASDNIYTRNVVVMGYYDGPTNGSYVYGHYEALDAFNEYKAMRLKYNKNLFGNIYVNVGGKFEMRDQSKIESGMSAAGTTVRIKNRR